MQTLRTKNQPVARRRRVSTAAKVIAVAAAAALSLTACASGSGSSSSPSGSAQATDLGTLNLQLSWIKNEEFSGEFFADSKGYFSDAGFSAVNMVPGPSTGVDVLLSGKADIALSDAISIGSAVAKGAPLKIIGTTYQKNPFTILSLKDKGNIATPQDLIGKKIGVQASNTSLFNAFLALNKIDPSKVKVVPVQYDPSVLVNGNVDGYVAYLTNESIIVENQGHATTNLPFATNGMPFVAETVTTTDKLIQSSPDKLKAFLKADVQGWTDAVNDPAAGAKLAVEQYGKDQKLDLATSVAGAKAQASELVTSDETKANGLFTISKQLQDETVASLASAGVKVTTSQLFDLSLLDSVYSANPELKNYEK